MRTQILEAATRLFAAKGYEGASLSAIAERVGIRKASLLYHFSTKDDLHRAVLDGILTRWNDVLPRLLEAAAGEDRFEAILDETVGFFVADPDRARLLLREALDRPEAMRARLDAAVRPWLGVIAASIRRGQETGDLRAECDPEAYVLQIIHLVVGGIAITDTLSTALDEGPGSPDTERLVTELKRLARAGLFTPAGLARLSERRARSSSRGLATGGR